MKHLTTDKIIEFVSIKELNDETLKIITEVNTHITRCEKCHKLVKSFQLINDELSNKIETRERKEDEFAVKL